MAVPRVPHRYKEWASATQTAPSTLRTRNSILETDRPAPPACFLPMPLQYKASRRRRRWRNRLLLAAAIPIGLLVYSRQFHPEAEAVPAQRAQLAQRHKAMLPPRVDAAALLGDQKVLADPAMEGRGVGTPGGQRARAFLLARFAAIGLAPAAGKAFEQPFEFSPGRGIRFWRKSFWQAHPPIRGVNVLGQLRGSVEPGMVIVVSAHYDHLGIRDGRIYPGADDNASGVAAMLAVATWFRAHPPRHTLLFAAFDGEESGLRGARAFVAGPTAPLASIVANINFDMLSRNPRGEIFMSGLHSNPQLQAVLDPVRATAAPTILYGHDQPRPFWDDNDWTNSSDQGPFAGKGIPWLYFGVEDHPDYHRPTDTFARVDRDFYVSVANAMVDVVTALDAAPDARIAHTR